MKLWFGRGEFLWQDKRQKRNDNNRADKRCDISQLWWWHHRWAHFFQVIDSFSILIQSHLIFCWVVVLQLDGKPQDFLHHQHASSCHNKKQVEQISHKTGQYKSFVSLPTVAVTQFGDLCELRHGAATIWHRQRHFNILDTSTCSPCHDLHSRPHLYDL